MESVTELLCQLIAIPSVNPMGRNLSGEIYFEGKVSDWLVEYFKSFGVDYERIEVVPGRDNILARYNAGAELPTLLWDAHQDTVPVDGMTVEPFKPVISQGKVYGRGACDVKGGLAAMLHAFRRICLERPPGVPNIVLCCSCDEESTALGVADLVTYWGEGKKKSRFLQKPPVGAVVAEPTDLDIVVAHRGVTRFKIHVSGRACHSSNPKLGVNAIYRMAKVVSHLEEYADRLTKTISPHPLCGGATLSVGRIEGGISVNVVPDKCTIEIDRRLIPGEDPTEAISDLRNYLSSRLDFDVEYEAPWIQCTALSDSNNQWLASSLLETMKKWDSELEAKGSSRLCGKRQLVGVPYGTNASTIYEASVPAIVFGPGSIAQAHTKDEYIEIEELEKGAEIYYRSAAIMSHSIPALQ